MADNISKPANLFTSESAREAQKRSVQARRANREKRSMDFEAQLEGMDYDSLRELHTQVKDKSLDAKTRQTAAIYLIDRIHGRPTQHTEADIHDNSTLDSQRQAAREKLAFLLENNPEE